MASSNDGEGPFKDKDSAKDTSKAADLLKNLKLRELLDGMSSSGNGDTPDMARHKFWQTQPVPRFNDATTTPNTSQSGPIDPSTDPTKVPQDPYPLLPGFHWETMDLNAPTQLSDVYALLNANYVEDTEAMFRFAYSRAFLIWALKSPGWRSNWHVGIRATGSGKLVAFISGVPCTLRVRGEAVRCSEINFLCVHKKLRSKRLAPVLIKEITRRCNLERIWQAIYTGGTLLPTPVATCRYFHRALDWPKLNDVGFSPLPQGSTRQRQVARYKLPEVTSCKGLRMMEERDVEGVVELLGRYLERMEMAQEFSEEEVRHWFLNPGEAAANKEAKEMGEAEAKGAERVVHTYVVADEKGKVTDFFSFYCIESTVIGNTKHNSIKVAYLFYYASEAAFDAGNGDEKRVLRKRLNELMGDALVLAKKDKFDVFNALTLLDNPLFLQEQRFGPGDGRLHYYLYNYRTPPIAGGINGKADADATKMGGVGVVML